MYLTGNEAECHPDIGFPNEKQGAGSATTASLASRRRFNREGVCDDENSPVSPTTLDVGDGSCGGHQSGFHDLCGKGLGRP